MQSIHEVKLNDLGLVRVLERAQLVYKHFVATRKDLQRCVHCHDQASIKKALASADKLNIASDSGSKVGLLRQKAEARLRNLAKFEAYVDGGVHASDGSQMSSLVQRGHLLYFACHKILPVCVFTCVAFYNSTTLINSALRAPTQTINHKNCKHSYTTTGT